MLAGVSASAQGGETTHDIRFIETEREILLSADGTIERGGIPTNKAHAQRWANENAAMYPDESFIVVEYKAETV